MRTLLLIAALALSSCITPGTLVRVDRIQKPQIEVYKYYYNRSQFIYVAKLDGRYSETINWWEDNGPSVKVRAVLVVPVR